MEVVGEAQTVAEARSMARERLDVVLMDYRLPDGTGAEATRSIKARWPACRVVMLTAANDDETILESIQAGADGYLTKDRAVDEVVNAVRQANAGETLLPHSVIMSIAQRVVAGDVPDSLKGRRVLSLDLAAMVARPEDLVRGSGDAETYDQASSFKAIDVYRRAVPTGANNALRSETTGGK